MEKQETIADILAAMRDEGHTGESSCPEWVGAKMRYYANRLEAAWKREKNKIEADALFVGGFIEASRKRKPTAENSSAVGDAAAKREAVTASHGLGDAAKLREALKKVAESSAEIMERVRYKDGLVFNTANYIADVARTALAEPPRNCDRFATVKDAAIAFARERQDAPQPCPDFIFSAWLFTKAKGEKK